MNGTITRLTDPKTGRARAYKVRWREGGRARSKTFPAGSKDLAERFLTEVRTRTADLKDAPTASVSVGWAMERMIEARREEVAPGTLAKWEYGTKHFRDYPRLWEAPITEVEPVEVRRFLEHITDKGLSTATVRVIRSLASLTWTWAVSEGYCPTNVVREVRTPRANASSGKLRKVRAEDVLSPEQVAALVSKMGKWSGRITMVLALTGMRQGEASALRVSDWDSEARTLSITKTWTPYGEKEGAKTYSGERTIKVSGRAAAILDQCAEGRSPDAALLTGSDGTKAFWPPSYRQAFHKARRTLGLPDRFTPHSLRHSAATVLISAGVPVGLVAATLGHSSPQITLVVYSHFLSAHWEQASEAFDAAFEIPDEAA